MSTVVFVRHGESTWNLENRFCGWADKPLTDTGKAEAKECGSVLKDLGFHFDVLHTSMLKRAIDSADIIVKELGQTDLPTASHWRLNERHYGGLQGLNKAETAEKYGLEQVTVWRRSYNVPPPPCDLTSEFYPGNDSKYDCIPRNELPNGESLELCLKRVSPYWFESIVPQLREGKTVLVVAHGNTIRSLMKLIEGISDKEVALVNLPHGVPLVYKFDSEMVLVSKKFLMSEEELKAKMEEIANQTVKK